MDASTTNWVYPATLKWAREQLGLSLEDVEKLSRQLGRYFAPITKDALDAWERGKLSPDLEHLETLSEIYVRPVGHFFLPEPPQETKSLSFRGLAQDKESRLTPLSKQSLRRFVELAEWTSRIIEEHSIEWEVKIQPTSEPLAVEERVRQEKQRLGYSPEVRRSWADPDEAFVWWRRKVEAQGIFCFQMKLDPGDIRGASIWLETRYPFILVNHQDVEAATGRLFTLLHEYAHLISATSGLVCDFRGIAEPFANQFAAQMLISHDEVRQKLYESGEYRYRARWSDELLDKIREPFFVSRDVIAITLQEMELAPEEFYQAKRAQWDRRRPWGRRGKGKALTKRERRLRELGFSLVRILAQPKMEGKIPFTDLSDVLEMKVEKVQEFLSWARNEMYSR
jgi:Zn-dependent peptidase ImmA (M78 family)/transcriptional regulator with XRE-family HTH domain